MLLFWQFWLDLLLQGQGCDIPLGYITLVEMNTNSRRDLFVLDIKYNAGIHNGDKNPLLGSLIGMGSAALVFEHQTRTNRVVKVSRHGFTLDTNKEVSILRSLKDTGNNECEHTPRFVEMIELELNVGGQNPVRLPTIIISSRGTCVLDKLKRNGIGTIAQNVSKKFWMVVS